MNQGMDKENLKDFVLTHYDLLMKQQDEVKKFIKKTKKEISDLQNLKKFKDDESESSYESSDEQQSAECEQCASRDRYELILILERDLAGKKELLSVLKIAIESASKIKALVE